MRRGGRAALDGLRLAVTTLTVLPLRMGRVDRVVAGWAMAWAPLVGALVGGVMAGVLAGAGRLGGGASSTLAAGLAVTADVLVTRALHLDGLADLADGLGSRRPAPAALSIMRRSDIGPFGVVAVVLTLLLQVTALAVSQARGHGPQAAVVGAVTGRLAISWACRRGVPAARPEGLGALVAGTLRLPVAVGTTLVVIALAAWIAPRAVAAVAAGLVVAEMLRWQATRRLGGITGDVLGALCEVASTTALVATALVP